MKTWKIWLWVAGIAVILGLIAVTATFWNNVSSEWYVESNAAQFALDHSPINRIDEHAVFTDGDAEEVFGGTDVFGRRWYVFVYGSPFMVQSVQADSVLAKAEIERIAGKAGIAHTRSVSLGYLNPSLQTTLHTQTVVAYEVAGTGANGNEVYAYYDARTGTQVAWLNLGTASKPSP